MNCNEMTDLNSINFPMPVTSDAEGVLKRPKQNPLRVREVEEHLRIVQGEMMLLKHEMKDSKEEQLKLMQNEMAILKHEVKDSKEREMHLETQLWELTHTVANLKRAMQASCTSLHQMIAKKVDKTRMKEFEQKINEKDFADLLGEKVDGLVLEEIRRDFSQALDAKADKLDVVEACKDFSQALDEKMSIADLNDSLQTNYQALFTAAKGLSEACDGCDFRQAACAKQVRFTADDMKVEQEVPFRGEVWPMASDPMKETKKWHPRIGLVDHGADTTLEIAGVFDKATKAFHDVERTMTTFQKAYDAAQKVLCNSLLDIVAVRCNMYKGFRWSETL